MEMLGRLSRKSARYRFCFTSNGGRCTLNNRRLLNSLALLVLLLSISSIVLILSQSGVDSFQQWLYLGSFTCAFFQIILYLMCVAVSRSQQRNQKSSYLSAFRLGILPWSAWIVYLIIRASSDFPREANIWQAIAFSLMCLAVSLMAAWWRVTSVALNAHKRRPTG